MAIEKRPLAALSYNNGDLHYSSCVLQMWYITSGLVPSTTDNTATIPIALYVKVICGLNRKETVGSIYKS